MSDQTISRMPAPTRSDTAASPTGAGRWVGGLGIVFTLLFAAAFLVLDGKDFSVNAKPGLIVDYYRSHYGQTMIGIFAVVLAVIAFAFFAGTLRNALLSAGRPVRNLLAVATVGTAVYVGGLLLMVVVHLGLVDAAHHQQAAVAQTLNYLDQDDFFPTVAGLSIFMLATGAAIVRSRALPVWLGWLAVAIGLLALCGPLGGIAFMIAPLWTLVAGIVLLRRGVPISEVSAHPVVG